MLKGENILSKREMIAIIDKYVPLFFPNLSDLNILISQLPCKLKRKNFLYKNENPKEKWEMLNKIFEKYSDPSCKFSNSNYIIFPEDTVPSEYIDELILLLNKNLKKNSVVIFGSDHINFELYYKYLEKYKEFNEEAFNILENDINDVPKDKPVNLEFIIIKDNNNLLNVFLQAKTHPFFGEESLDINMDLYRSKYFYLFSSTMVPFNFMSLICFDYVYRDNYWSNIYSIVKKANQLYFTKRQELDLLIVIECNPKPEHRVFIDTLTGFYGEHLFKTPGTRDTISIFVNSSEESKIETLEKEECNFGYSHIVLSENYKIPPLKLSELTVDDFMGAPLSRIRFNPQTRLYHVALNFLRDKDPRSSRVPVKINGVYKYSNEDWQKMSSKELLGGEKSIYNVSPEEHNFETQSN
jgi:hypothetical protein